MKTLIITIFTVLVSVASVQASTTFSPQDTVKEERVIGAFDIFDAEIIEEENVFVRSVKELPIDFTGYKVELLRVYHQPLDANDALFQEMGGVEMEKINDFTYAYVVGNFNKTEGMEHYLKTVARRLYPNAASITYKNGIRVKK
jgi:hypothetical protein